MMNLSTFSEKTFNQEDTQSQYNYTPGYCWLPRPTTGNDLETLQKED